MNEVTLIKRFIVNGTEYQPQSKTITLGFSWTTFLFGPVLVSLFRKDWKAAGLWFILNLIPTSIISSQYTSLLEWQSMSPDKYFSYFDIERIVGSYYESIAKTTLITLAAYFVIAFFINKNYVKRLVSSGWLPINAKAGAKLAAVGIRSEQFESELMGKSGEASLSITATLKELNSLAENGILTTEEFEREKAKILGLPKKGE